MSKNFIIQHIQNIQSIQKLTQDKTKEENEKQKQEELILFSVAEEKRLFELEKERFKQEKELFKMSTPAQSTEVAVVDILQTTANNHFTVNNFNYVNITFDNNFTEKEVVSNNNNFTETETVVMGDSLETEES